MKNQRGFSLIELLIVVVIIGIIAAIAIPNLLAARRHANEQAAMAYMADFVAQNNGCLKQSTCFAKPEENKYGYAFQLTTGNGTFDLTATPQKYEGATATGKLSFYANENGFWYKEDKAAPIRGTPLGGTDGTAFDPAKKGADLPLTL